MIIYLIMLLISLFFAHLYTKHTKKIYAFLSMLPFLLISGLRYGIGTDYFYRYAPDFNIIVNGGEVKNLELGFKLLYKLIGFFTNDYAVLFIITSMLVIIPIFYTIFKFSKKPVLSILLFFLTGYFFLSLNMVRQFVSMSILFSTYHFFVQKKYFYWILAIVLAFFIHQSSLIFIIIILFQKHLLFKPVFLFIFSIIILLFSKHLHLLLIFLFSLTPFSHYMSTGYAEIDFNVTLLILNVFSYCFMYYFLMQKSKNLCLDRKDYLLMNIQGFSVFLILLGGLVSITTRLVYFFSLFQIISIVNFSTYRWKRNNKILLFILCLVMSVGLIKTHVIANNDEVIPYHSIFERV